MFFGILNVVLTTESLLLLLLLLSGLSVVVLLLSHKLTKRGGRPCAGRISESLGKSAKHTPVNLNTLRQINMGPRRGSWSQTHSDRLTAIVCGARDRECGYGATAVCAVRRCMGGCDGSPTNSQHCCYCSPPMLNVNVLLLKSLLLTTLVFNNSSTVLTP